MDQVIIATRQPDNTYIISINEYGLSFLEQAAVTLNKKRDAARKYARGGTNNVYYGKPRIIIQRQ